MTFITSFRQIFKKKTPSCKKAKTADSVMSNSQMVIRSVATDSSGSSRNGYQFKFEDGRRFHANDEISYFLPNDDDETDRVHQQHWILRYALQCNYHAPVTEMLEEGINVLDSGCGPATWVFEMGETYQRSTFHGVDAACVFPEDIKPANVELVIGNVAKNIPYPDENFHYVHQRLLFLGLSQSDWDGALKEIYRVLKPGGYIELVEPDLLDLHNVGPLLKKLQDTLSSIVVEKDMPTKVGSQFIDLLEKTGYVNIVLKIIPLKLNHTNKAGELLWDDYHHGTINMRTVLAKVNHEWEDEDIFKEFVNNCGVEAKTNETCINYYVCYAQKPLE
ncbi:S-adenosyl-L-methionine-dependent methyltransferase [Mucor mucedo]|uniref:S-adenosyl-L-methionine-dependent methyltransferase n=1 Tax=Mucor mucedo TaxID=29922 RepID=UPI00221F008E|nr:S-adenosyl-L-methionine-dependent methyltransferase [Mucor mucedo]KAI7888103.1 S-adenosyl-L-methionine-dependent methyltransferase [Mucor mucedo]